MEIFSCLCPEVYIGCPILVISRYKFLRLCQASTLGYDEGEHMHVYTSFCAHPVYPHVPVIAQSVHNV